MGRGLGGVFGAALTFIFPLAGLAIGAAGGALIGKLLDRGLDKKFVTEVGNALTPGSSALVLSVGDGDAAAVRAAFDPFTGKVFQTSLDPELEDELNHALK